MFSLFIKCYLHYGWQRDPNPPFMKTTPYIAYPPFFKFCPPLKHTYTPNTQRKITVEMASLYENKWYPLFYQRLFKQPPPPPVFFFFLKNFMALFYGWGSTASRLEPLRRGSLLFTSKFPEIPGTHFIDLGRMKGWVDLGATQWFWARDLWIGNPAP